MGKNRNRRKNHSNNNNTPKDENGVLSLNDGDKKKSGRGKGKRGKSPHRGEPPVKTPAEAVAPSAVGDTVPASKPAQSDEPPKVVSTPESIQNTPPQIVVSSPDRNPETSCMSESGANDNEKPAAAEKIEVHCYRNGTFTFEGEKTVVAAETSKVKTKFKATSSKKATRRPSQKTKYGGGPEGLGVKVESNESLLTKEVTEDPPAAEPDKTNVETDVPLTTNLDSKSIRVHQTMQSPDMKMDDAEPMMAVGDVVKAPLVDNGLQLIPESDGKTGFTCCIPWL